MQRDLASASQRLRERRNHHRLGRVLQRHVHLLETIHRLVQLFPLAFLRTQQHHHQVRAHREIVALIGDHQRLEVALRFVEARVHHGDVVGAQRIHLAVELDTKYAIAQIHQRRSGVLLHNLARAPKIVQRDHSRPLIQRLVAILHEIEVLGMRMSFAFYETIKRLRSVTQHFANAARQRPAFGFHPLGRLLKAERVPKLERPQFMRIAPAHRPVDLHNAVRNFRNPLGRIEERIAKQPPQKTAGAIVGLHQGAQTLTQILDRFRRLHGRKTHFRRRMIFQRLPIDHLELALGSRAGFLIETLPRLLAQPLPLQHHFLIRRGKKAVPPTVLRHGVVQVLAHVRPHVQPDQIEQPETGAIRQTDQRPGKSVHFLDGVIALQHGRLHRASEKASDAVGDEIRRILARYDALAKPAIREAAYEFHYLRRRIGAWD